MKHKLDELRNKKIRLEKTGFFHVFSTSIINKIVTFMSAVILIRIVSKSEYGKYSYAENLYSLIMLFSGLGISSAVLQVCSEQFYDKQKYREIYNYGMKFGIFINAIIAVMLFSLGFKISFPISEVGELLSLNFLFPILYIIVEMSSIYMRTNLENKKYAAQQLFATLSMAIFTIAGAYSLQAKGMILGRYIGQIFTLIFTLSILHVPIYEKASTRINRSNKNDLLKIAFISMIINGLSQLLYLLDVFVIGIVMTDELEVASYKVATQIPTALSFIPASVVTYIYPYFARNKDDYKWCMRHYFQLIKGLGAFNLIMSGIIFLLAPYFITFVYGKQYMDAVVPFRVLVVSYYFSGTFRTITGNLLVTQRKLKFNLFVAIISGGLNAILDYLFIKKWGITGASISTIIIVIITSVMNTYHYINTLNKDEVERSI